MSARTPFVVGFDLDMTLVDSRQGIVDCMQRILGGRGIPVTEDQLWPLIGAPLVDNLGQFLPTDQVSAAAEDYRADYLRHAVQVTTVLPGAVDLIDRLHADGAQVLVVSAKSTPAVQAVLEHVGLAPDVIAGDVYAADKAVPLRAHGARMYVGDHQGDMRAAEAATAYAVGVLTGPHTEAQLRAAGAQAVVPDLIVLRERLKEFEDAALTG